ncbi:hypothetical protein ACSHWB_41460 [Lentzea sp. HUAS TT2]|uniref:hypothetical protein n=1 Tax=Lentzea sp. HUAS TT2 TaxID=3447454 RepID=UPI003F6ECE38
MAAAPAPRAEAVAPFKVLASFSEAADQAHRGFQREADIWFPQQSAAKQNKLILDGIDLAWYPVVHKANGKCVDAKATGSSSGTVIQQRHHRAAVPGDLRWEQQGQQPHERGVGARRVRGAARRQRGRAAVDVRRRSRSASADDARCPGRRD